MQECEESLVYEDAYFRVEHSGDCSVPGYLVLGAKDPVTSVTGLTSGAQRALGPVLALLVDAIEKVVCPDLVYCAQFGEGGASLHFHLFPRTASLASEYLAAAQAGKELNGPVLLNWARERYVLLNATETERTKVKEVTQAIRQHIKAG